MHENKLQLDTYMERIFSTRGDEEPTDDIDTRLQATLSFEEVDPNGRKTMGQIEFATVEIVTRPSRRR